MNPYIKMIVAMRGLYCSCTTSVEGGFESSLPLLTGNMPEKGVPLPIHWDTKLFI